MISNVVCQVSDYYYTVDYHYDITIYIQSSREKTCYNYAKAIWGWGIKEWGGGIRRKIWLTIFDIESRT